MYMLKINKNIQSEILITTMEEIVPEDSLFRKVDKYIDFTFIYDEVKDLYSEDNGRPSIDPVVLFKLVFIQALDGIKSMRQTCKKIKVDSEYRWFLGIPFGEDTPHFSTFSKNYERRFKDSDIFESIFINIVNQAIQYKLVEGKELYHFRKEKVERSFADSKQNHGYRYAMYRGLKKNQNYTWLICAAQNMKNIAIKKEKVNGKPLINNTISQNLSTFIKNTRNLFLKIHA